MKFPGHADLVVYVWVDAPIGYIGFTEEWAKNAGADWKTVQHLIEKGDLIESEFNNRKFYLRKFK